jgi:methylenetetrahydrofolate--tRNA-(uracil-5-)-methyltransferase
MQYLCHIKSYKNDKIHFGILMSELIIIGGGLAGAEAAWQAAERGIKVMLYEKRPLHQTPAHNTSLLGELICSNSFGSKTFDRPSGLLKSELKRLGSFILNCAENNAVPAGSSLSVDRFAFASEVTERISSHPNIIIIREEMQSIPPNPCIIASGPLTSKTLTDSIIQFCGIQNLFFFDAIAPIIEGEKIDFSLAFFASRFGRGENEKGDYINCPFTKHEYEFFVEMLSSAERIPLKDFEKEINIGISTKKINYFEACLPVEIIASRSKKALTFGPMRPVGVTDPHSGKQPYAIVQLRQDNLAASLYNLVGFQTNLTFSDQDRVFHTIPGLKNVKIIRHGQMHRNTYLLSPMILKDSLQTRTRDNLFFAGQITGVEGYVGSIACGLVTGINASKILSGQPVLSFPIETMIGSLCHYIANADPDHFQPIKANFGILPGLPNSKMRKFNRSHVKAQRAIESLKFFIKENNL